MSLKLLLEVIHSASIEDWKKKNEVAFRSLFGVPEGRYPKAAENSVKLRAPEMNAESGVPFAAYIDPSNANSGAYSGLSFAIFPITSKPCLITLIVGTLGLTPDEAILGRPGHARKAQAICSWLNRQFGNGSFVAWAKQDPTRTDITVPENIRRVWSDYKAVFERYGKEIYAVYCPNENREGTEAALTTFLDLLFQERDYGPLTNYQESAENTRSKWFDHLMPSVEEGAVLDLLARRRFVILQGPPGTGKTRMATKLLTESYSGRGQTIQFHPNTTYENFIGGLAPAVTTGELGLRFAPTQGALMRAAKEAIENPKQNYLLHIDEINRADLGKVLGESILLLEASANDRKVEVPYDFGEPFHRVFFLPLNLHILGTMNTADRSIAILDVAIRRRFGFVSLWPRMSVVEEHGCAITKQAFRNLVSTFVEHAPDDALSLIPGHAYFLESDESRAKQSLQVNLVPLLEEYLAQGYVGGFAEQIRGYLQQLPR